MTFQTLPARLAAKVNFEAPGGCWLWQANLDSSGYGAFKHEGSTRSAHRVTYQLLVGSIPDGMLLDHLCFHKNCVNPKHLRPVTRKQNGEHREGANSTSGSGIRGVHSCNGKWRASVRHNGVLVHGGYFASTAEAEAAVVALRARLFTHDDAVATDVNIEEGDRA